MKVEVLVTLLTVVLGVIHLFLPSTFSLLQNGLLWGVSPRDDSEPIQSVMGLRAARANANFHETAPFALALLILVVVLGKTSGTSAMGAWIYIGARVIYLPLYLLGIPYLRTAVWGTSLAGLFLVAMPIFM